MDLTLIFTFFSIWLSVVSAASKDCYFPGKANATYHTPCDDTKEVSACCGADAMCLRNGACLEGGRISRGSCTDITWNSSACFPYCRNGSCMFTCCAPQSTSSDLMRTANANVNDTNVIIPCDGPKSPYLGCNNADCQSAVAPQPGATGVPEGLFEMAGNSSNVILRQNQNISEVLPDGDVRINSSATSMGTGYPSPNTTCGNDTSVNGTTTPYPCPSSFNSGAMAGVGVGVGVPLLIIIGVLSWLLLRKKKNAGLGAVHERNAYATKAPGPPHQIATEQASPHGYNSLPVQPPVNTAKTSVNTTSPEMEAERRYG
jgi:hypothetical protein